MRLSQSLLESGHSMDERDEVICIEVQHWNTTLCLFLHFAFKKIQ